MKKFIVSFLILGLIIFFIIICNKCLNAKNKLANNKVLISYYVETGDGTGVYEKHDGDVWLDGYVLNEEKSGCDNGGNLVWDYFTKTVDLFVSKKDNCKVYMDKKDIIYFTLPDYEGDKINLVAEKGMTWKEWELSDYSNNYNFTVGVSDYVLVNFGFSSNYYVSILGTPESRVLGEDEIINNCDYIFYVDQSGGGTSGN